jgi:hypothetical protein
MKKLMKIDKEIIINGNKEIKIMEDAMNKKND